jgi:hypothetical protein
MPLSGEGRHANSFTIILQRAGNPHGKTIFLIRLGRKVAKYHFYRRVCFKIILFYELMHMIRKGQMAMPGCEDMSFANQFYALAGQVRPA